MPGVKTTTARGALSKKEQRDCDCMILCLRYRSTSLHAIGVYQTNTRIIVRTGFTNVIKFAGSVGTGNSRKKFRRIDCVFRSEWAYEAKREPTLYLGHDRIIKANPVGADGHDAVTC